MVIAGVTTIVDIPRFASARAQRPTPPPLRPGLTHAPQLCRGTAGMRPRTHTQVHGRPRGPRGRHRLGHLHRPVQAAKCGDPNRGREAHQRRWQPLALSSRPLIRRACHHNAPLVLCSGDLLPLLVLSLCSHRQAPRQIFIAGGTRPLLLPVLTTPWMCSSSAHSRAPISRRRSHKAMSRPFGGLCACHGARAARDEMADGRMSTGCCTATRACMSGMTHARGRALATGACLRPVRFAVIRVDR